MTKADIINRITVKSGISRKEVEVIVSNLMETLKSKMTEEENIYLRGFGSFVIKERAQKTTRNISKNTTIIIPAHKIPAFKPSKEFVTGIKRQQQPTRPTIESGPYFYTKLVKNNYQIYRYSPLLPIL